MFANIQFKCSKENASTIRLKRGVVDTMDSLAPDRFYRIPTYESRTSFLPSADFINLAHDAFINGKGEHRVLPLGPESPTRSCGVVEF
jgi:hypothetical protein